MKRVLMMIGCLGLSFSTVATELAAVASDSDDDDLKPLVVRILKVESSLVGEVRHWSLSCEASNPNKTPLMFVGYRADSFDPKIEDGRISPIYVLQHQQGPDGKWKDQPLGWCGTGIDGIVLKPGSRPTFSVLIRADATQTAVRVGIRWSKPVKFDEAPAGAFKIGWSNSFELGK